MNNAKMWLVVKPTVGIPLFLSAVAIGSFAVHVAVLTNTSWVSDFLSGQELGSGDAVAAALKSDGASDLAKVTLTTPGASADAAAPIRVVLPDGTTARLVFDPPTVLAAAGTEAPLPLK